MAKSTTQKEPKKILKNNAASDTIKNQIIALVKNYIETKSAILADYLSGDDSMITELELAEANLLFNIEGVDTDIVYDFDFLLKELKNIEVDFEELLEWVSDEDESLILENCRNNGYAVIKIENLDQKSKLEDFVKTELYPFYNDENKYFI